MLLVVDVCSIFTASHLGQTILRPIKSIEDREEPLAEESGEYEERRIDAFSGPVSTEDEEPERVEEDFVEIVELRRA